MIDKASPARRRARSESRDKSLQDQGYRDYAHYLKSAEWKGLRARFIRFHGEICALCATNDGTFNLHHMTYDRVGHEALSDLVLLCEGCHHTVHVLERRGEMGLDFAGLADFKRAAEYAVQQEARREAIRSQFGPADWTQDDHEKAVVAVSARLKRTLKSIPPERARALMDDILAYAKELSDSDREDRPYEPFHEESSLDFRQPPHMVIAQLAGRS